MTTINSWASISLSYAGRKQLANTVLSSKIMYWIRVFIIPNKTIQDLGRTLLNFLWTGTSEYKWRHRMNVHQVTNRLKKAGLESKTFRYGKEQLYRNWYLEYWMDQTLCGSMGKKISYQRRLFLDNANTWRLLLGKAGDLNDATRSCELYPDENWNGDVSFWHEPWPPQGILRKK